MNIGLATGNIGREGGGVCRLGGHQEGYFRPSDAHVGRPAPYVDQLLIAGGGKVHHIWANDHYKTTLNAAEFKRVYNRRTNMVKEAMDARAGATREELVDAIVGAINAGGLFAVNVDIIHSQIGQAAHVILPAVESGEMNLTSMNGERRMRLVEKYMDAPGQSHARLPDRGAASPTIWNASCAKRAAPSMPTSSRASTGRPRKTPSWTATTRATRRSTYDRLRAMGNNGVQEPVTGFENGKLVGTKRLYEDGVFTRHGREDGKALFCMGAMARASGARQGAAEGELPVPDQQRPGQPQLAELVPRPEERLRHGPLPGALHPDQPGRHGRAGPEDRATWSRSTTTSAPRRRWSIPSRRRRPNETFMLFGAPNGRAGQRDQRRHQRVDPAELQADLGATSARSRMRPRLRRGCPTSRGK